MSANDPKRTSRQPLRLDLIRRPAAPIGLMHEAGIDRRRSSRVSLTALVASPGYFHGQVAAEFVHFLLINKMRVAANYAQSRTSSLSVWPANVGPPKQAPILWSSQSLRLPVPRDELILGDHVSSRLRAPHPALRARPN